MVTVFVDRKIAGTRHVLAWLKTNNIEHQIRQIKTNPPTWNEFVFFLLYAESLWDVISPKSNATKKFGKDKIEELTLKEVFALASKNPGMYRQPITIDKQRNRMLIGWNTEDIGMFAPRIRL